MRIYFSFLSILISLQIWGQAPAGYYNAAEGKTDEALKTSLYNIVGSHTVISYDGLWTAFKTTDKRSDGKVWDIYSNTTNFVFGSNQCGNYSGEGNCYNREHSFPKSWFNDATPMYSDLFHLYPSDGYVNNRRSNYPFGEVGTVTYESNNSYSKLGASKTPGYSGTVFEPADELKGDLARTYFYMVTAYENRVSSWNSEHLNGTSYPALNAWSVALFLKWNQQDPVSQKEINRNNTIYSDFQHNRNPFIDHPELAEYIWGSKKGQPWTASGSDYPYLSSPLTGSTTDFGKIPYNQTTTKNITITGVNLTGNLTLTVSGTNAAYFTIPISSISKSNALAGYNLAVTYKALALGAHNAILTISGGGLTNNVIVNLTAMATDSFIALDATNVMSNGFTANWTSSPGATNYLLDVYSYGGTQVVATTLLEEDFNSGLPSGWTSSGYTDNQTSSNMRLGSGSNPGSVTTQGLDLSSSTILTVRARQYNNDAGAKLFITCGSDTVATLTTAVANQDFTIVVPNYTSSSKLTFSAVKSSRVFLDYVKLTTEGSTLTPIAVSGYPKPVGNILSYPVAGLASDSVYYYTVTPQGNGASISDIIRVKTSISTAVPTEFAQKITWHISGNTLYLNDLPRNSQLRIFDILGKSVKEMSVMNTSTNTTLPYKGVFLVHVYQNGKTWTQKILYAN